jgi:hypothetical protein
MIVRKEKEIGNMLLGLNLNAHRLDGNFRIISYIKLQEFSIASTSRYLHVPSYKAFLEVTDAGYGLHFQVLRSVLENY